LAETLEAGHAPSEPGQFGQGGVGPAAAVFRGGTPRP
jgi:hypothetical protein